eukprot:gene9211-10185_t
MAQSEKEDALDQLSRPFSAKSHKSFKQLVKILGPVLKVHLGKVREEKNISSNHSTNLTNLPQLFDHDLAHLEEKMNIEHLNDLMSRFETHYSDQLTFDKGHVRSRDVNQSSRLQRKSFGLMDLDKFQSTISEMLSIPSWDTKMSTLLNEQTEMLFRKIDRSHEGLVSWDNFCTYIIMRFQEQDLTNSNKEIPFITKPRILRLPNVKEAVSKIMIDYNPTRFVTVSKEGIIGVWGTNLDLIRTIEINNTIEDDSISGRRRTKLWVTDAICMPNVHKLAIASTNRDIRFFDMSTPSYKALFHLCGRNAMSPHRGCECCLCWRTKTGRNLSDKSMLLFGTDRGDIHILTFPMPIRGLFEKPFKKTDSVWRIIFNDLNQHSRLVSHSVLPHVHSDWVRRMRYLPESDMLISCSSSSKESLVFRSLDEKKRKPYYFRVMKGIDCFDYCKDKAIIATGGVDHIVRLWDPYVTFKPIAVLKGHQASVIDVAVHEELNQVFSYSKDGCLRSWDIVEFACIQCINIRLPFGSLSVDYGNFPFFLAPSYMNTLIICVGDCLAELKLGASTCNKRTSNTHSKPLCSALYNKAFKQVITGSEASEVIVWDLETGKKTLHLKEVHGREELSCMALDGLGQRLFTGARDGSAYIWNLTTGLLEKKLETYEDSEITGMIAFPDREQILTVGWSRKLLMYNDSSEGGTVSADPNWAKIESHSDDILSASYYPPNLVATSTFDGGIYIWSLEREKLYRKLKDGKTSLFKKKLISTGVVEAKKKPVFPVDNVLFLTNRLYQESAVLVSTEAGKIEFWPIFGVSQPTASFFAASTKDSTILAVATDDLNHFLLSGDSCGVVVAWDIARYCNSKTFNEVVNQVLDRQHGNLIPRTMEEPPQVISKWHAHNGGVVSVQFVEHAHGPFIISGSTDGSVKLWTLIGALVGMFGQKILWDLARSSTYHSPVIKKTQGKRNERIKSADAARVKEKKERRNQSKEQKADTNQSITDILADRSMIPPDEKRPYSTSALPDIRTKSPNQGVETLTKDVQIWTNTEYYRSRTMVLDDVSKRNDVWSILGENYNESFKRRMTDRRSRRNNFSQVDGKVVCEGAMGANVCSPFKALYTPVTKDFELPQGLPITPRMVTKGIDPYHQSTLGEQNYGVASQSAPKIPVELVLPAIRMQGNVKTS